ncbi:hypothetical protein [Pseudodesulfovibrio pelocollis]|uniref:hypothetical protein n=1 Tax=Pseudodesulfovibrio pelocollis TaxID=3051432 RepID=UPI00255AF63C|nr:hypothetical protein [Pseudodesulfovibrio sp. SB368]
MHDKETIMRNWQGFTAAWPKMWLAFGQVAPGDRDPLTLDVWEQVQRIPGDAWPYIVAQVRGMDSKPRNWAKTCRAIHAQWSESPSMAQPVHPAERQQKANPVFEQAWQRVRSRHPALQGRPFYELVRQEVQRGQRSC